MKTAFRFPPFVVVPAKRLLLRDSVPVPVTPKTFDTLLILLEQRNRVVSKEELLSALWPDTVVEEATLTQHIYKVRKALNDEDGVRYIETVPRHGYRFAAEVSESDEDSTVGEVGASSERRSGRALTWRWMVGGALIAAAAASAPLLRSRSPEATPIRFTIAAPEGTRLADLAVSPDGQTAAFRAVHPGGTGQLWLRRLDSLVSEPIEGTDDGASPFFSPDGRAIGFFSNGKLRKVGIAGGASEAICDVLDARGGTWNKDDVIVFAPSSRSGLFRVSAAGGRVEPVTRFDPNEGAVSQRWPAFLPDGRHFLFLQMGGRADARGIYVASLDASRPTRLLPDDSSAIYARDGYLLFGRDNSLLAQPFDARRVRLSGDPVVVARGVGRLVTMYTPATVSDNGRLIYEAHDRRSRFVWFDRRGQQLAAIGDSARQGDPVATPDGSEVLSWKGDEAAVDLWLDDVRRGTSSRLTFSGQDVLPIWSPNADETIFRSNRSGTGDLYRKSLRRTDPEVLLLKSAARKDPTDWSLDGRYLLYDNYDVGDTNKASDIWVLPLLGDGKPVRYAVSPFSKWAGRFSPDDRWIAYDADDTGKPEVYVQAFPATNVRLRVSTSGGDEPQWRRDGRELFYLAPDGWLTAVSVNRRGASLDFGTPQRLFQIAMKYTVLRNLYAVSADGEHFLVDTPIEDAAAVPLTVIVNWPAGLHK